MYRVIAAPAMSALSGLTAGCGRMLSSSGLTWGFSKTTAKTTMKTTAKTV